MLKILLVSEAPFFAVQIQIQIHQLNCEVKNEFISIVSHMMCAAAPEIRKPTFCPGTFVNNSTRAEVTNKT